MPDAVVGTVCVAPRARSANRRVYFLELQGDDDTRHHVLCKATMLGGLLPDEATVPFAMHTVCHAPRTSTHAPDTRTTHTSCKCHAQVALHRDLRQGDTLAVQVGRRELCAAPARSRLRPYSCHGGCFLVNQVRWQGSARADPYPPRHPREHREHQC